MKKLFFCLLIVVMLFSAAGVFAEVEKSNALTEFVKETDLKTQDFALQSQSGNKLTDLVIRVDGETLHLVTRNDNVQVSHIQMDPTGVYMESDGSVTLLRYATVTNIMQDIANEVGSILQEVIKNIPEIPEEDLPSDAEVMQAVSEFARLASAVQAQEQADAATLTSAAMAFAANFKPEYILDVKEDDGSVEISLRSGAYAVALAEAMDELMSNPDLANLVDRQAALDGDGTSFVEMQLDWLVNREEYLEAIRSIESTEMIEENGHYVSHFQIGKDLPDSKILGCDSEVWVDAEDGEAESKVVLGFKDDDPILVYEFEMDPYYYWEKMSSGDSKVEIDLEHEKDQIKSGKVVTIIEGKEYLKEEVGPDYLYLKGEKGGISTSVRETWSGKTRYELFAESADGKESNITVDFYEDDDSLVCELMTDEAEESAKFMLSRIDKLNIEDLSASKNINEITVAGINAEIESALKTAYDNISAEFESMLKAAEAELAAGTGTGK